MFAVIQPTPWVPFHQHINISPPCRSASRLALPPRVGCISAAMQSLPPCSSTHTSQYALRLGCHVSSVHAAVLFLVHIVRLTAPDIVHVPGACTSNAGSIAALRDTAKIAREQALTSLPACQAGEVPPVRFAASLGSLHDCRVVGSTRGHLMGSIHCRENMYALQHSILKPEYACLTHEWLCQALLRRTTYRNLATMQRSSPHEVMHMLPT